MNDLRDLETEVSKAFGVIKKAFEDDPDFAHGWHCNIAMSFYDAMATTEIGEQYEVANDGASRFMRRVFGVNTKGHEK